MPNWCSNFVTVEGKEKDIERYDSLLRTMMSEQKRVQRGVIPTGMAETGNHIWLFDMYYQGDQLQFESKWGPISDTFEYISRLIPDLYITVEYEEPGCEIFGVDEFHNGDRVIRVTLDEDETDLEYIDEGEFEGMYKDSKGVTHESESEYYEEKLHVKRSGNKQPLI